MVFFDGDFADLAARLRPKLPKVRHWVCLTPDRSGSVPSECEVADDSGDRKKKVRWLSYEKLVERSLRSLSSSRSSSSSSSSSSSASPSSWTPVDENAACGLCYTSGTTGRPKGVLYSHRSNVLHALSAAHGDALDVRAVSTVLMVRRFLSFFLLSTSSPAKPFFSTSSEKTKKKNDKKPKQVVPIFHANGWGLSHACPMTGAALILPGRHVSGRAIAEAVREFQVSMIAGVPTIFLDFVAAFRSDPRPFPSLESVVIGGAACPPSLAKSLREEVGVAKVNHVYGMTELSPIGTIAGATRQALRLSPEEQHALGAKQGRPSLLVDLRVVDERGRELPRDGRTPGELQARGPHVIHRYANAPRPAVVEGPRSPKGSNSPQSSSLFFPTGDLATIDAMGFMKIVDRTKDVIKSGGEFISSPQLEAEAMGHPFVEEAAAIGVADERWGERPLLFMDVTNAEKASQLTEDEVKGFLKGKVASWWVPEKIVIGVKMIPHGATGKVDKKELRRRFLSGEVGGGKFPQQQQTLCKL